MKQPEYTDGPNALENYGDTPKPEGRKTRKKSSKVASERKPKTQDND
jgi:hypothetical protein